ncbi:4-hydroxy-tetrahydrodipicolinate synthase [Tistlia consotensis]|uniref:4-hydroxy-tetrahydrodipicolinate synthase n=1 Tax=Tistlia consotensis USBA 355 TaxID=560819 RepID=A0A1Y6C164_9PROT|nr:dihydrodipicolinate synthase family protein [Tistlia consotensis]SMF38871.1 4-hydroxy-tetrahydrodipicolinate synthase [Tistlia consotensis USBA 355]SNR36767.1 4-hydroxy-tetrahydrodipicolinate synthase [Tistlia consotensis]
MSSLTLRGFVPAVVTPFDESGAIRYEAFSDIVEWLIGNGADGICVAGDNGESWALDAEERRRLASLARERIAGRVPLVVGVSATSNRRVVDYAAAARDCGADAVLLMPQPYVLKASRAELLARFAGLADAVDIPIVLYNSPRRSGISLSVDDIEAICEAAPIVGLKESSRDFVHVTHLLQRLADRIAVMIGPTQFILPGLALGARGFIATGPELLGPLAGQLCALAAEPWDARHRDAQYRLTAAFEALSAVGTWPAALKAGLGLLGQPAGVPREPVIPLAGEDLARLRAALLRLSAPLAAAA